VLAGRRAVTERYAEHVTAAHLRGVRLPTGESIALITLDNGADHTKPTTFGPQALRNLAAALERAEASDADAIAVTGKPFVFSAGADLQGMRAISTREQALAVLRLGHAVFRRLGESAKPTFAFVNGVALGGGLELALHCTHRTLSSTAGALALPECLLGLVPAWGGSYLLPRLVGAEAALKVIVDNPLNRNTMLTPTQAVELGIADVLLEPADFLEQSLLWAGRVVRGEVSANRREPDLGTAWEDAVRRTRAAVDARLHAAAPAPLRAIELVGLARTATRDEAFTAEDEAGADLVMSEELRAGLYAFELVQRRAKRPAAAPAPELARPVTKVGIVGAGLMASQLALLFARRLHVPVVLTDLDQDRLDRGIGSVHAEVDALLRTRRIAADAANRLKALVTGSLGLDAFADADFVLEAVFEDLTVKRQVLAEVEAEVKPEAVLASNTSSLSISAMSSGLAHPERVVGFHFFNPVAVLPLLEVVRGERTDDATLATAFAVGAALRKSCVSVRDAPAFVVNRLLVRFAGEVLRAVDEGTPVEVADRAFDRLGLPMSPFTLLGLVGPAVALHTTETLHAAYPDRFAVSRTLRRLAETGETAVDAEVRALVAGGDAPLPADEVRRRALDALAEEVRLLLDEGVVAEPQDVDLCLLLGAGWPFHLGGVTPYLDRTGTSERVTGRRFLPRGVASLPEPRRGTGGR
jgi:3-hydroxyacyl-CoA dehydrogenase/enoyl-CoA hydratase/carnithine racemase